MLKLNKVNIINYDLWDADTGEADVVFKTPNNLLLKAFSLDEFSNNKEELVVLSIFPKEIEVVDLSTQNKCQNILDNFQIELIGDVEEFQSNEEEGKFILVNYQNILFLVFLPDNEKKFKVGDKVKVIGRLDMEKHSL
jgi:hypothetical protein